LILKEEIILLIYNSWLLKRIIVVDGNFKAELLNPKYPANDISLTSGEAYVTEEQRYSEHLKEGKTYNQVKILIS
jgi:hypothetical protein